MKLYQLSMQSISVYVRLEHNRLRAGTFSKIGSGLIDEPEPLVGEVILLTVVCFNVCFSVCLPCFDDVRVSERSAEYLEPAFICF